MTPVIAAIDRTDVAAYIGAVLFVYSLLIVIYVLTQMIFSLGARAPYSRWLDAVLSFLRDVCDPFLRVFRAFVPMLGPLDLSPIVAILALNLVGGLVVRAIHG